MSGQTGTATPESLSLPSSPATMDSLPAMQSNSFDTTSPAGGKGGSNSSPNTVSMGQSGGDKGTGTSVPPSSSPNGFGSPTVGKIYSNTLTNTASGINTTASPLSYSNNTSDYGGSGGGD